MQFGDFPSQTLPIRWVKPLERNLNLLLSIVSPVAVLFTYHIFFFEYFRCRGPGSDSLGSDNDGVQFRICLSVVVVQLLTLLWLFATPWTASCQLPCPSLSPRVCSNSCPLSQWWYLNISSSAALFSFCPLSFPASGSFPISWLFASGGQSFEIQLQHQSFRWIIRVDFL